LDREVLFDLYKVDPDINYVGRQIAEQSYIQALQRIHDLQTMDGRQRVLHFLEKSPGLINRVQKQHLASYLGMHRSKVLIFISKANNVSNDE